MKRANGILAPVKLIELLILSRPFRIRSLCSQVTRYSHLSRCFVPSLPKQAYVSYSFNTHQKLHFSSNPNSIVEIVSANEWSDQNKNELENKIPALTPETVLYVLKQLDENPEKAFDFFNWASDRDEFKPSAALYGCMLRILGRKESMEQFWLMYDKMSDEGFNIDRQTYLTLLGNFRAEKMASEATALTHKVQKSNASSTTLKDAVEVILGSDWNDEVEEKLGDLSISLSDNNVLFVLNELRGYPLKALRFFHWCSECPDYAHNAVTYNAILRVVAREDSIAEFWSLVKEMKAAGHEIDIDTYIKLSRQFQKSKMMKDAVELYELMMDGPYKPSVQSCCVLLRHISMNPDLVLVSRVTKKFEATGYSFSKAVYDGIHRSLTSVGRFDEAEKIFVAMISAGHEPDNITYSQLVFGLCKARRLPEACKVLDDMEAHGCVPDIKTWTILIDGHCKANEFEKALIYFTKMLNKNCDADAALLNILVNGFYNKNKAIGAYTLLVEMVERADFRPWQTTYKNLIQNLLGEAKLEEALNILRLMKKQKFIPFVEPFPSYISKFGTVEDASAFLKVSSNKSTKSYLHIFQSFFQEGRHSEAKDILFKCPHHIRKHGEICNLFGSVKHIEQGNVSSRSFVNTIRD